MRLSSTLRAVYLSLIPLLGTTGVLFANLSDGREFLFAKLPYKMRGDPRLMLDRKKISVAVPCVKVLPSDKKSYGTTFTVSHKTSPCRPAALNRLENRWTWKQVAN